ncbi:type VI secretion system baseplate subunit TssF [Cereibacter sphaeroides]|uniref:type VI secretion system baseplate subunit TssF n=1 Tax=Cereibacter sphaeroides TaxID=1063 RepID=UPI001F34FD12|nr:type VI secretion system baseplate subunit TssF [Cereibacter sphaeroides]MCE6959786.1 type VI secretion system baseplate subunit TssF [Cereibacter sphaeroides]MCE6974640.1 type VI secretion system baseplate subunit TssF [Cereibacter sphaeroides]
MDRTFLAYYESELAHIRELAVEFGALHPNVARNLSLDSVPCPDPYVERLLEGVAWLAARTRLKLDTEAQRQVRAILDWLYPDLAGPAPAMALAVLQPGAQVLTLPDGHCVRRGTRLVAGLREGLSTRATYTTAQDVTLWPVTIEAAGYLQDRSALKALGLPDALLGRAEAGLRLVLGRTGPGGLADLSLDRLDLCFAGSARAGPLFDAIHGRAAGSLARAPGGAFRATAAATLVGIADSEALLPRLRPSFEGYRLIREYFLMPERFHFVRLDGLNPALREARTGPVEIVVLLAKAQPALSDVAAGDFRPFVTPVVNLFEKECNIVDLDPRREAHVVHADRTRPRDFEIYRLLRVEDADVEGPDATIQPLHSAEAHRGAGLLYTTERRPRRPGEDELRRGQTRTSYTGDDLFLSLARRGAGPPVRRLDIRALCTNRDLPILDDSPRLTLESGDPVGRVELLGAMRRPRGSLAAGLPRMTRDAETALDELSWRLAAQLSLDHLSLADGAEGAEPLRAMLDLYADRGDPAVSHHARAVTRVRSRVVTERLDLPGPVCFGRGQEITLDLDETILSGGSALLLPALLAQLFARQAAINGFIRVRTRLARTQEEVAWPMTPGTRPPI